MKYTFKNHICVCVLLTRASKVYPMDRVPFGMHADYFVHALFDRPLSADVVALVCFDSLQKTWSTREPCCIPGRETRVLCVGAHNISVFQGRPVAP